MSRINASLTLRIGAVLVGLFVFVAVSGEILTPFGFDQVRDVNGVFGNLVEPNSRNVLGTTMSGFDVFSRLILGAKTALTVLVLSVALAASLGIVLGLIAGYFKGPVDKFLSLIADALFAIPALLIALVISFSFSSGSTATSAITAAVIAEGLTFSARYFRIVRAEVRVVSGSRYVEAARVSGISNTRLLLRHVLPNSLKTTPVIMTQNGADAILTLAGLGFLGVGISANSGAEWGYDLSQALGDLAAGIWWTGTFTAIAVSVSVIGLTFLGEGLADKLEARSTIG